MCNTGIFPYFSFFTHSKMSKLFFYRNNGEAKLKYLLFKKNCPEIKYI